MTREVILERLYEWAAGKKAPPVKATLIITNQCDLNCLFCRGTFHRNPDFYKGELSEDEWIKIVKDAIDIGIKEWAITGGEPFIKANTVISIIRTIINADPPSTINIVTNGSFITPRIADELVQVGCNKIEIGIDGPNAEIHDFLRGSNGSFEKSTNSVKYLAEAKKKLGKKKPIIELKTVLNSRNYDKLKDLVLLASSLGADVFEVVPMRTYSENRSLIEKERLILTKVEKDKLSESWKDVELAGKENGITVIKSFESGNEEVSTVIRYNPKISQATSLNNVLFVSTPFHFLIKKILDAVGIKSKKDQTQESMNRFFSAFCFTPFYSLVIDANGNVSPCPSIPPSEFENLFFLNLRETTLKEIWYGDFFELIRKLSINGKYISKNCATCGLTKERKYIIDGFAPSETA